MKRKLISSLLCLCMLVSLIPVAAFAAGNEGTGGATTPAAGSTEATVKIGNNEYKTTNHAFTAKATDKFVVVKSGTDGIEGNNHNQYGYYPAIIMPTPSQDDMASTYYILSRSSNTKGLNEDELGKVLKSAIDGTLSQGPVSTGETLSEWFQVYTAAQYFDAEKGDNSTYWPQIGSDAGVNIVVAKATTSGTSTTYTYDKYTFNFKPAAIDLPFTVTAATNEDLEDVENMTVETMQSGIKAKTTPTTIGEKTVFIEGASNYVSFPWFASGSEGNYVALKIASVDGITIKSMEVTLSDGTTKKPLSDGDTLIWQITDSNKNKKIPLKVTLGDNSDEGATIVYYLDLSNVQREAKKAGTELSVVEASGTLLGKDVTTVQSEVAIDDKTADTFKVTGKSVYTTWDGFSNATAQKSGHYIALKFSAAPGATINVKGSDQRQPNGIDLDADGILITRLENIAANNNKLTVTVTNGEATKAYTVDLTGLVQEKLNLLDIFVGDTVSQALTATAEKKNSEDTITISGSAANIPQTGLKVKIAATSNFGTVVKSDEITLTKDETTGKLTSATQSFSAFGTTYKLVFDATAVDTPIVPPATDVKVEGNIPEGKEEAVLNSAGSVTTTDVATLTDLATAAAAEVDKAQDSATDTSYDEETAKAALQKALGSSANVTNTTVVVQPYLDVSVGNYTESSSSKVLNLDISAKYRVVATNVANPSSDDIVLAGDGVANANAVDITKPNTNTTMTVETEITIKLDLPSGFVSGTTPLFVKHHDKHYHQGTVTTRSEGASTVYSLTFKSTDGLSPFSIDTSANPEAKIGETYYNTFNEAVNAVKDGETITIMKNGTYEATVNSTLKFKVEKDAGASSATVTLKDYNGNVVNADKDGFYNFTAKKEEGGGGGGGVSSNVTIDRPTNGKVSVTPTAPSKGATVTINLTPDTGYAVGTVTVTDKDGKAVELTKVSDTKYTFTMPDGKVKVAATFTKVDTPPATGFTDVPADAYYADAVKWAVDKGITNGLTATTFGPNNSCTRAQMVTFLWRGAGSPAPTGTNSFTDVASGEYYYNAVLWAVEKGITNGTTDTTFSPNATVNRAQTVTFLYRYAGSPAATGDNAFTDVAAGQYYTDAVKWAVAEEITNGTSATTFAPNNNCTRGQIVTFLYRQMAE